MRKIDYIRIVKFYLKIKRKINILLQIILYSRIVIVNIEKNEVI